MTQFQQPRVEAGSLRAQALSILSAAWTAVDPAEAIRRVMRREGDTVWIGGDMYDLTQYRRVIVIGGGKAGASMAGAVEQILAERLTAGYVNVKYGHSEPTQTVVIHEAGHPLPDQAGVDGAQQMVELLRDTSADDLVLCLISGGGSALMTLPVEGVTLEDMQELTQALLRSGAPIQDINTIRKHLSQIKGGQLARLAFPATVVALILSDVVGSPLDVIASGPTVTDPTTFADVQAVIERYGIGAEVPGAIRSHVKAGLAGAVPETIKAGDPVLARVRNVIVGDNSRAAEAALAQAKSLGFNTLLLSTYVEGEAREVARVVAALAKEIRSSAHPVACPACLVLGGETTVTLGARHGIGGRNQELALAAALAIQNMRGVAIVSFATDGTDGPTDAAGGLVSGETVKHGAALGLNPQEYLDRNDAYPYLKAVGDLLVTGPTKTNVNDLIVILVV